jgi:hypothetical protein
MAARAVDRYQFTRYHFLEVRSIAESFTDIMAEKTSFTSTSCCELWTAEALVI